MQDNITKSYKKSNVTLINSINKEATTLQLSLSSTNRIEQFNQREAFVTPKDHEVNFKNDPKCRLTNPAKSEIGIISRHCLELINNKIREKTQVNQWRNAKSVIEWFKSVIEWSKAIKNKSKSSFIKFDIIEFYPSISKKLL